MLKSRTVIVSLLVGVLVTFVASLIPALRSTRVPPIAALHAFVPAPSRRRRIVYLVFAGLLTLAGAGDGPRRAARRRRASAPAPA